MNSNNNKCIHIYMDKQSRDMLQSQSFRLSCGHHVICIGPSVCNYEYIYCIFDSYIVSLVTIVICSSDCLLYWIRMIQFRQLLSNVGTHSCWRKSDGIERELCRGLVIQYCLFELNQRMFIQFSLYLSLSIICAFEFLSEIHNTMSMLNDLPTG